MKSLSHIAIFAAALVTLTFGGTSQLVSAQGAPNWTDACNYPIDVPSDEEPAVQRLLDAEAILIPKSEMSVGADGQYLFTHSSPNPVGAWNLPFCSDSIFYNEQTVDTAHGRSGFLIGPNLFATSPHATDWDPGDYYVIFGITKGGYHTTCDTNYIQSVTADNVYTLMPNSQIFNVYANGADYIAFHLDRPVVDHAWLRLRSSGGPSTDDSLAVVGHPYRVLAKFEYGVSYVGPNGSTYPQGDPAAPLFYNYHYEFGNSGSPVFNLTKEVVESAIADPSSNSVNDENNGTCESLVDLYDLPPGTGGYPQPGFANHGLVEVLAATAPTLEVRVAPMQDATYILPVGGNATPASSTYTISASQYETGTSFVVAGVHQPIPAGEPDILTNGANLPNFWNLTPGQQVQVSVNANVPSDLACGTYDRFLEVDSDSTYQDLIRHRFEVGLTDFTVDPVDEQHFDAVVAPPLPKEISYTLANTRPSSTTVKVSLGVPWLKFTGQGSGGGAGTRSITLAAAGMVGDSKTVQVTLAPPAYALTDGDYQAAIQFENLGNCPVDQVPQTRTVTFGKGKIQLDNSNIVSLLGPTPPNPPYSQVVSSPENFCITHLALNFDVFEYGAGSLAILAPSLRLFLYKNYGSPTQTSMLLWDQQAIPPGWVVPTYNDPDIGTIDELLFDDRVGNVPPTGASFDILNGKSSFGKWQLMGYNLGGSIETVTGWGLEIAGQAGSCPQ